MSIPTPDSRLNLQIYREACEWLIALRTSRSDATDREPFDAWLRQSPEHVRAYLEVSAVWEDAALHDPARVVSAEAHVARAKDEDNLVSLDTGESRASPCSGEQPRGTRPHGRNRLAVAMAAAIAVALVAAGLEIYINRGVYATGIGEERSLSLADGSLIDLNAESRIRVRYFRGVREVDLLSGEALFKVVHDPSRPFLVRSGAAVVRDLGTEFDVYRKTRSTTVTVIEGQVAVGSSFGAVPMPRPAGIGSGSSLTPSGPPAAGEAASARHSGHGADPRAAAPGGGAGHEEILLTAGEQVTVAPKAMSVPARVDVAATTAWTQRKLVFDSVPLSLVVRSFNRYNVRPIIIDDPGLDDFRVIGVFSSTDPGSLIRFLSAQPGISVVENAREIRITREQP